MSGYAPNPTANSDSGAAPLTASLLARKGEALPAVDADVHAGVDVASYQTNHAPAAPRTVSEATVQSSVDSFPLAAQPDEAMSANLRPFQPPQIIAAAALAEKYGAAAPGAWTVTPPKRHSRPGRRPDRHRTLSAEPGSKATVTFRMRAKDFIRLRFASRDLEMSCQSIILDALDTYLDANDVADVPDDVCDRETTRLKQTMKTRRRFGS